MQKDQETFYKKFGKVVRELRLEKELTLEDMQDFGFSAQHFQKIEKGLKAISFYTAIRIIRAFGTNLAKISKILDE